MAWTQSDLDALQKAVARGVKRVVFVSGETRREQEFHSLADMRALLDEIRAEVEPQQAPRITRRVAGYNSGLC